LSGGLVGRWRSRHLQPLPCKSPTSQGSGGECHMEMGAYAAWRLPHSCAILALQPLARSGSISLTA